MSGDFRPVLLLVGVAFVFNLGFSLSGFYNQNYDSWAHMFYASHYMNSWFDTWDARWFGGMSVTSYPPLLAQLLALVAFVTGLEYSYVIVSLLAMMAVPVAVYYFSRCFLPVRQAFWAGLFSILLPSLYLANYTWGQLPTILALAGALFAATFLWRYLESGHIREGLIAALFCGVTAATHHLTFICFIPGLGLTVCLAYFYSHKPSVLPFIRQIGFFGLITLPLVLLPIFPFWQFLFNAVPQSPIHHFSRDSIFTNPGAFWLLLIAPYMIFLLGLPLAARALKEHRVLIPFGGLFLLLFILGLGGTTPVPSLIFGAWWQWLIYDRFALWAGILLVPLVVRGIRADLFTPGSSLSSPVSRVLICLATLGTFIYLTAMVTHYLRHPNITVIPPAGFELLADFLDANAGPEYRYITLGLGEAQVEKLSTLSRAGSLDGGYFTARTLPVLTESGIGMIDSGKFIDPELETLNILLANAQVYSLKWVVVNDMVYYPTLEHHGFSVYWSAETALDNRLGAVTIWQKDGVPPLPPYENHETGFSSLVWGLAPLLEAGVLAVLLAVSYKPGGLLSDNA